MVYVFPCRVGRSSLKLAEQNFSLPYEPAQVLLGKEPTKTRVKKLLLKRMDWALRQPGGFRSSLTKRRNLDTLGDHRGEMRYHIVSSSASEDKKQVPVPDGLEEDRKG
mmetsp:Transcript_25706/g.101388  ORF Transcript_25706/g.101388 Transcript_25706/m.101388 type:complete len:108 (-) Transcript_25706:1720-2043(-)